MAEINNTGRELDWNDTIEHDSTFVVLPAGDYPFIVTGFERGRHNGSEKLSACNMAIVTLDVSDPVSGQTTTITENLPLHTKMEWKLCQFFTSVGLRKSGERLQMGLAARHRRARLVPAEHQPVDGKARWPRDGKQPRGQVPCAGRSARDAGSARAGSRARMEGRYVLSDAVKTLSDRSKGRRPVPVAGRRAQDAAGVAHRHGQDHRLCQRH